MSRTCESTGRPFDSCVRSSSTPSTSTPSSDEGTVREIVEDDVGVWHARCRGGGLRYQHLRSTRRARSGPVTWSSARPRRRERSVGDASPHAFGCASRCRTARAVTSNSPSSGAGSRITTSRPLASSSAHLAPVRGVCEAAPKSHAARTVVAAMPVDACDDDMPSRCTTCLFAIAGTATTLDVDAAQSWLIETGAAMGLAGCRLVVTRARTSRTHSTT